MKDGMTAEAIEAANDALRTELPEYAYDIVNECIDASFDCGEHDDAVDGPYEPVLRRALIADHALLSLLVKLLNERRWKPVGDSDVKMPPPFL
jgi:hypothetical protein